MRVSIREEQLAEELYTQDMNQHQGPFVSWNSQIDKVKDSYRRQAMRIVNTKWFKREMKEASLAGAYQEAVARSEADSNNRV